MNENEQPRLALHDAYTYAPIAVDPADIVDSETIRVPQIGSVGRLTIRTPDGTETIDVAETVDMIKRTLQLGFDLKLGSKTAKR